MQTTTLGEIKAFSPCKEGWKTPITSLGTSLFTTEVSFLKILESNGIEDAIWALRTRPELAVKYAIRCAEEVLPIFENAYPTDTRVRNCIEVTKSFIEGTSTLKELNTAAYAADAAANAAYANANTVTAYAYAAYANAAYAAANANAAYANAAYANAAYAAAKAAAYAAYANAAYAANHEEFQTKLFIEVVSKGD